MSNSSSSQPEEPAQLTPEQARFIVRARRYFLISMGLLLAGFIAVAVAVVYKSDGSDATALVSELKVPAGAEILSVVPGGDQIAVTFRLNDQTRVHLFDRADGSFAGEIAIVEE